jgi:hypothetical protein
MDEADIAQAHIEQEAALRLQQRRPIGPRANGRCHFCECVVVSGLFCDSSCRDDYEREQAAKQRNGRPE